MIRSISDKYGYKGVMAVLSLITFAAGFAVAAIGELMIPVASSAVAALFIFESPQKRFLSYIIPALSVLCAFLCFGPYSLISAQFIVIGLILALCYSLGLKKAETAVYLTLAVFILFIFNLYLLGAKEAGSFAYEAVAEHYKNIVAGLKDNIFNMLISEDSAFMISGGMGTEVDEEVIRAYIDGFIEVLPALFAVFAFAITGFTIKLFVFIMLKISKHGILKKFAHFVPSSLVSYLYVIISIIAMLSADGSVFSLALVNARQLLMFVFAYIGFQYVLALGNVSGRKGLFFGMAIAAFILFPQGAVQILSYLGAWFCISLGKNSPGVK